MEKILTLFCVITVVILIPLELYIRYKKGKKDE